MRTIRICVILEAKHLILAGLLTSSPSSLVMTSNTGKQALIWRCHKTKQPGMMSQHVEDTCSGEPPGPAPYCFSKNFYCGQTRRVWDCLSPQHKLAYPD